MKPASRQRWVAIGITLAALALTAIFTAQGATQFLAASLLPMDAASNDEPGARGAGGPATSSRRHFDATPILHRNIFDSETGPLDGTAVVEVTDDIIPDEPVEIDPNAPPPACTGSMRLVGAYVRLRRAEDSFAAITNATGTALLYQEGMEIDNRTVVAVQHNRVILQPSGGEALCSLSMFGDTPRVATARAAVIAPATPRVSRAGRGSSTSPEGLDTAELEAGITQVSERQYTIDRALVNRLLTNQAALMRTARVIPHEENGQTVGVKLYGIRRSSLLGRLGIQNGDMLRTINGFDMTAPDSALQAYARLRNADRITIALARRGQDMTVDYQIR